MNSECDNRLELICKQCVIYYIAAFKKNVHVYVLNYPYHSKSDLHNNYVQIIVLCLL